MFQLVHLVLTLKTAKTFHQSPDTFSPVHGCVCAFASLASWLHNRISRDFAAVTRTSVCACEREREAEVKRPAKRFSPYRRPQSDAWLPFPVARTAPCQNHFAILWTEPTIESAVVVPVLSVHLLHSCLKAFLTPLPTHHILYESCLFISLFCKCCCFYASAPAAAVAGCIRFSCCPLFVRPMLVYVISQKCLEGTNFFVAQMYTWTRGSTN